MSDRDDREEQQYEESRESKEPRRTYHEERHTVDYTGPLTRLAGVAGAVAGIVLLGFYLERVGLGDEFGTFAVVTIAFSIGYWADKRPDKMRRRAGTFWRFADAARESREDIRRFTYRRPFRVAVGISALYAIAIVLAKSGVVALLSALYDWRLAAAVGAIVGAFVVAPQFFSDIWGRISQGPSDHEDEEDGEEYEYERGVPREHREDKGRE